MADDSNEVQQHMEFHPCLPPRGMLRYDLDLLSDHQKACLKEHKLMIIRENNIYLQQHPELKLLVSVLLKEVLIARPQMKLEYFLAKYLSKNWEKLKGMMAEVARQAESSTELSPEGPFQLRHSGSSEELDSNISTEPQAHKNVMFRGARLVSDDSNYGGLNQYGGIPEDDGDDARLRDTFVRNILNSHYLSG